MTLKEVHNCQYVACMNPTAGSFTINPRLQVGHMLPFHRRLHAVPFFSLGNWETGASERARPCLSLAPVSQLLWTRKESDCVQSPFSTVLSCQGSKLEKKIQSHLPSGDDVRVKSSHNFATATDVLVAIATTLVAFATVLVAVSSPARSCALDMWGPFILQPSSVGARRKGSPWDILLMVANMHLCIPPNQNGLFARYQLFAPKKLPEVIGSCWLRIGMVTRWPNLLTACVVLFVASGTSQCSPSAFQAWTHWRPSTSAFWADIYLRTTSRRQCRNTPRRSWTPRWQWTRRFG